MKNRIIGSLSDEEEEQLNKAIEENNDRVAGEILERAAEDNKEMDRELAGIRANLAPAQVLSRDDLAKRLSNWQEIGLPECIETKFQFNNKVTWQRPVFDTVSRQEPDEATTVTIEFEGIKQVLAFDPEFLLFGPKFAGARPRLAGLTPWINKPNRHSKHGIAPSQSTDLVGKLFQEIARHMSADFLSLPAAVVGGGLPEHEVRWLLFCTHPLRESENVLSPKVRPYLTYYAFGELSEGTAAVPMNPEGADANDVHTLLERAETHAVAGNCEESEDTSYVLAAKRAGSVLHDWVTSVTQFGAASFLEEPKYFVPIPVCLVRVVY